ncbi:hypothetical protein C8R44DRAFT_888618 [Mycena epipterygia]|nr:hypothetical protein C8R44DRAFT_888618 [Mycena epipterygia]
MSTTASSSSLSSPPPTSSARFLFVVRETGSIYFEAKDADEESRRSGAREVRVVRTFEEAVKTLQLDAVPASGTADSL